MDPFEADYDIEAQVILMKKEIREGPLNRISSNKSKHRNGLDIAIEQYGKQVIVRLHHRKKRSIIEKCLNDVLAKVHTREQGNPDFLLCYGNFREDEDLFIRFEELNFKVNEIRAEKKMEPTIHAEIEYPEIKAKFHAQKLQRDSPVLSRLSSERTNSHEQSPELDKLSEKLEEDFYPESATVLFPPHPENAFSAAGVKQYSDKSWELPHLSETQSSEPPYKGLTITELDWSANTEV